MWQLSGSHGYKSDLQSSLIDMKSLVHAGFVTLTSPTITVPPIPRAMLFAACNNETPLAGPAEDYVGAFRDAHPDLVTGNITFLTKWVPRPGPMPLAAVESALAISRRCVLLPRGLPTARRPKHTRAPPTADATRGQFVLALPPPIVAHRRRAATDGRSDGKCAREDRGRRRLRCDAPAASTPA